MKGCQDISSDFKDLHYKNFIDIRASCQSIDLNFIVMVDMIESVKRNLEDHFRVASDKVRSTVSNLEKTINLDWLLATSDSNGEETEDMLNIPD